MSLLDTIRQGVKIANSVTRPLQPYVMYERSLGDNGFGTNSYASPVQLHAIVDWKQKHLRTQGGELTVSRASVQFLDISEVVAATDGNGIDDDDKITLPDGTTGPIIDMAGFIDAGTGHPFATEVFLG